MTGLAPEGGAWGGGPSMFSFQKIFENVYLYVRVEVHATPALNPHLRENVDLHMMFNLFLCEFR